MSIGKHLPEFYKKDIKEERRDEIIEAGEEFIAKNENDPHLEFKEGDLKKIPQEDLELAKKFQEDKLTEKEITEQLEKKKDLLPQNKDYNFLTALKNKLLVKKAWENLKNKKKAA